MSTAVDAIRSDIVRGRLRTGGEIVVAHLSEQLDVSMSAVQQALLRLADQHLVSVATAGSFHVVSASLRDLRDLTALRQLVEGEAVQLSVARSDPDWAARVRNRHDDLAAVAGESGLAEVWRAAHSAFHAELCSAAGNERLVRLVASLRDEAEIYRELSAASVSPVRRGVVAREHRELMELAATGRAAQAAEVLRGHLEGTMVSIGTTLTPEGGA